MAIGPLNQRAQPRPRPAAPAAANSALHLAGRNARARAVVRAADFVAEIAGQHAPGRQHRR